MNKIDKIKRYDDLKKEHSRLVAGHRKVFADWMEIIALRQYILELRAADTSYEKKISDFFDRVEELKRKFYK